jgi:hypothetical protein
MERITEVEFFKQRETLGNEVEVSAIERNKIGTNE